MIAQGITCTKKKNATLSFTQHKGKQGESLVFNKDDRLIECVKTLPRIARNRSRNFRHKESGKFRHAKVFEAFRERTWLDNNTYTPNNENNAQPFRTYKIVTYNIRIPLFSNNTNESQLRFKNTLSKWDKSALASALFLLKIDKDTFIQFKMIVFDNHVNSLDEYRMNGTCDKIIQFCSITNLIIILTHTILLLKKIYDKDKQHETKLQQIGSSGASSKIMEFDVTGILQGAYFKNYGLVYNFALNSAGYEYKVARTIRILLEADYRFRFPNEFLPNKWLGEFIETINESYHYNVLYSLKNSTDFTGLKEINNYSNQFHHDQKPDFETVIINLIEVKTFCKRTIDLITK